MSTKVKAVPDGYHSVTPRLIINGAAEAIEFYKKAFGAKDLGRSEMPGGKIAHAEIQIGDSRVMMADEFPEFAALGGRSPRSMSESTAIMCLYVDDVDAVVNQAVACGAKLLAPVADQFYGDRSTRVADPFGHLWMISTHIEDVSPEEMERRMQAWAKK